MNETRKGDLTPASGRKGGRPKTVGEIMSESIFVRLTPSQMSRAQRAAAEAGESPATWARRLILASLSTPQDVPFAIEVICPTGETRLEAYPAELIGWQTLVGGSIEEVRVNGGCSLIVNEEGRLRNLPMNPSASEIAGQPIFGTVVKLEGAALAKWRAE